MRIKELALPAILISEIILCALFGDMIPADLKSFFLSLSLTLKSALLMVLPFVIFSFVVGSMSELKKGALTFVVLVFALIMTSNYASTGLAGVISFFALPSIQLSPAVLSEAKLLPLWSFDFPKIVSNEVALFSGMIFGVLLSIFGNDTVRQYPSKMQHYANQFLKKCFIPILPIFVLGFIIKIEHEGILDSIFANYFSVIVMIVTVSYLYVLTLMGLAVNFNLKKWARSIQRLIPAMVTGFSTMSSASALPLLLTASESNTNDKIVRGSVPISVNTHLIGDCFSLSILSMAILLSFGQPLPSPAEYMLFMTFFVLAKFAVAGVPGGTVLVMLPVFEKYLGFNSEMLSLITILYILFDPVITPINLLGNGSFAMIFARVYRKVTRTSTQTEQITL